jgi:Tol biopolymer transport system component
LAVAAQAAETTGGWSLLWWGRDGKRTGSIAQSDRYFYPALSPDGTRLAVCIFGTQGTGDVWVFDLKRGTNPRLTFGPALQSSPTWTPDGKTIFYDSTAKAADGSGSERVVLESHDMVEFPLTT